MSDTSRWIVSTRNKLKLAVALAAVAFLLLLLKFFEQSEVEHLDQVFLSIYADRLVPATAIFDMREQLHQKQSMLQTLLAAETPDVAAISNSIQTRNQALSDLLGAYKKTYFLPKETDYLHGFEASLLAYNQRENTILEHLEKGNACAAFQLHEQEAMPHFAQAVQRLSELNHIQSDIGKDMLGDSQRTAARFLLLSKLELGLIVLFSVLAHVLIYASRAVIQRKFDRSNWN